MTLSMLMRKDGLRQLTTLTVATPATAWSLTGESVATVTTVAVAEPEIQKDVVAISDRQPNESNSESPFDDVSFMDDRRHCSECANLAASRCLAAWRGEIEASRHYRPLDDLPRRCEGYRPTANDPDQRSGKQRWPGLARTSFKGGK
jgi:hypothetical protein